MKPVNPLVISDQGCALGSEAIIFITHDGKIYWMGREVISDDDFKAAMIDLAKHFAERRP